VLDAIKNRLNLGIRSQFARRTIIWATQIAMFALSGVTAFQLRFDFNLPPFYFHLLAWALCVWIAVKIVVFRLAKLDRSLWSFVSFDDIFRVAIGNAIASFISFFIIDLFGPPGYPRSVFLLDLMICFLATSTLRVVARLLAEIAGRNRGKMKKRALIYGAGMSGVSLLREIQHNSKLAYRVCGFIDDRVDKQNMRLTGIPVLGGGGLISRIAKEHCIDVILIAIPSATGEQMSRILELCHAAGVECKTIPGLADMMDVNNLAGQIREVNVEDLLGRTAIHLDASAICHTIEGKVILVTGVAGSIGSELCRQIASFRPAAIVGYEIAESPLFEFDREMRRRFPQVPFHPEIGSVQNRSRFEEVLFRYQPKVVYHAAAYKHVPLMEKHVFEAIENNVFGTYNVAAASAEYGVEEFLLISTDKAVHPTNVMGASKRIAELILLALQNGRTRYVAVRFGNVLGSNGSVVPIFKQQIAAGGPVTVTHPEMRRYFMTIPEACQLVLQALAIAKGGQICVLDMGHQVKIVELARKLILLSGLRPDEDIRIEFTGIRPGEKLFEELSSLIEDTVPTVHEKIRIFIGNGVPENDIDEWLEQLRFVCHSRDLGQLMIALKEIVPDYNPSTTLLKRVVKTPRLATAKVH
jgi:FlaA1/EpsC-like NDP-sugar epimerase